MHTPAPKIPRRRRWLSLCLLAALVLAPEAQAQEGEARTWAACRLLHLQGALSPGDAGACAARHRRAPESVTLGLRMVFVNSSADPAWLAASTQLLDRIYAAAGIRFRVDATVEVRNARVDAADGVHRLDAVAGDVIQHLQLSRAERGKPLEALRARLAAQLVSAREIEALLRRPQLRTDAFWKLMARAFPESIYVVLHPGARSGGNSSGPGGRIDAASAGIVELRPDATPRTLAHEIGHYFGLHHTHARSESAQPVLDFPRLLSRSERILGDLRAALGDDYSGTLPAAFLPYDASPAEQAEYEHLFTAASLVAPLAGFHYKAGFAAFQGLGDFLRHMAAGQPAYRVNFVRERGTGQGWRGNNCRWNRRAGSVECTYGGENLRRPETTLPGSHPVLSAGMTGDEGRAVNLMSYVQARGSERERLRPFLNRTQLDVVRRGVLQPTRLHLRHH